VAAWLAYERAPRKQTPPAAKQTLPLSMRRLWNIRGSIPKMSEEQQTVSVTPETDDFAARYDRMIAPGSGGWIIKVVVVAAVILVIWGAVSYFAGS